MMHNALTVLLFLKNACLLPLAMNTDTQHPAVLEQLGCQKLVET